MSSHIGYVKRKGTCTTCKKKGRDALIPRGELYWTRDTGLYPIKFHFGCYWRGTRTWANVKLTEDFLEEVSLLQKKDQRKVLQCFHGTEERVAALGKIDGDDGDGNDEEEEEKVEEEEEEEEKEIQKETEKEEALEPKKKKRKLRLAEEILADCRRNGFSTATNKELKAILREKELPVSGKKAELVARAETAYAE
jgi:hypothetical protein